MTNSVRIPTLLAVLLTFFAPACRAGSQEAAAPMPMSLDDVVYQSTKEANEKARKANPDSKNWRFPKTVSEAKDLQRACRKSPADFYAWQHVKIDPKGPFKVSSSWDGAKASDIEEGCNALLAMVGMQAIGLPDEKAIQDSVNAVLPKDAGSGN